MKQLKAFKILFIAGLIIINGLVFGQKRWNNSYYKTLNHRTFRKFSLFNKKIDENNIDYPLLHAAIFFMVNECRSKYGRTTLAHCEPLEVAAFLHSRDMALNNYFSHTNSLDKKRATSDDRARLAGITNPSIAENVHYDYNYRSTTYLEVADRFIKSWLNSKGHRNNILSPVALQAGCGAYYQKNVWHSTQMFQFYSKAICTEGVDKMPKMRLNAPKANFKTKQKPKIQKTNKPAPKYYIVCGSYDNNVNANKKMTKLKQKGNNKTQVIYSQNKYRVALDKFSSRIRAEEALKKYQQKIKGVWILTISKN